MVFLDIASIYLASLSGPSLFAKCHIYIYIHLCSETQILKSTHARFGYVYKGNCDSQDRGFPGAREQVADRDRHLLSSLRKTTILGIMISFINITKSGMCGFEDLGFAAQMYIYAI